MKVNKEDNMIRRHIIIQTNPQFGAMFIWIFFYTHSLIFQTDAWRDSSNVSSLSLEAELHF